MHLHTCRDVHIFHLIEAIHVWSILDPYLITINIYHVCGTCKLTLITSILKWRGLLAGSLSAICKPMTPILVDI